MKIKIVWIGKTKQPEIEGLTQDYLKRLRHYAEVEGVAVKDEPAVLKLSSGDVRPRHTLLLLDSHGKQLSSEEFAHWLADFQQRSVPLLIAIGPADGFSPEARKAAGLILSFGKMTMAHELARVVLLEQLYRAFTILKGHPYHLGH
ncbi:MAG TPA: 23S rRNA (pseudouridine(1915)-N(3))-methyltransferase RlmH [Terriglobales bacterium]|nr:23S rRNA (pseudouridine(1915)-N(3))-methyltransferase RlmH [Terriglobales bacterium]